MSLIGCTWVTCPSLKQTLWQGWVRTLYFLWSNTLNSVGSVLSKPDGLRVGEWILPKGNFDVVSQRGGNWWWAHEYPMSIHCFFTNPKCFSVFPHQPTWSLPPETSSLDTLPVEIFFLGLDSGSSSPKRISFIPRIGSLYYSSPRALSAHFS